jgi:hypothetical protein
VVAVVLAVEAGKAILVKLEAMLESLLEVGVVKLLKLVAF